MAEPEPRPGAGSSAGGKAGRGLTHGAPSIEEIERDAKRHELRTRQQGETRDETALRGRAGADHRPHRERHERRYEVADAVDEAVRRADGGLGRVVLDERRK